MLFVFVLMCMLIYSNYNYALNTETENMASYLTDTSIAPEAQIELPKETLEYIAVLEIPQLDLKKGLYDSTNKANNVEENITLIEPSLINNPTQETIVIAAHSGNSQISFFHNLHILNINDIIYLYHDGKRYEYQVINKYETIKDGTLEISNEPGVLYLTTCSELNKGKQLVIETILKESSNY